MTNEDKRKIIENEIDSIGRKIREAKKEYSDKMVLTQRSVSSEGYVTKVYSIPLIEREKLEYSLRCYMLQWKALLDELYRINTSGES